MKPRWYQATAEQVLWDFLPTSDENPLIVLPTAAGKSPLMAMIARTAYEKWNGRIGIMAKSKELIRQNHEKLRTYWPEAPAGIYSASLGRRDRFDPILFLQIQSAYSKAELFGPFDILLIDESHGVALDDEGMYRSFIAACKKLNPTLRVIGVTATDYRTKGGPICGPEYIFNQKIYEVRIPELIADGYLSNIRAVGGSDETRPDLYGVRVRGKEYVERELAAVSDIPELVERACDELVRIAGERKRWLLFAVNLSHANHIAEALNARGVPTAVVWGDMPAAERDDTLAQLGSKYRAVVNVAVLVEGYDDPLIDLVGDFAATKAPGRYYQKVGRGFRVVYADGYDLETREGRLAAISAGPKPDCLYADFAGNALEHGPVDAIKVRQPRKMGEVARVVTGTNKECPLCRVIVPSTTRKCPTENCGQSWLSGELHHLDRPIDAPVLSTDRPRVVNTHAVRSVGYARHEKAGKVPSLKVTYQCGLRRFSEWVCLQHSGMAHSRALQWWMDRSGGRDVPRTVEEALPLACMLPEPAEITVDETDKYPRVIGYVFADKVEHAVAEPVTEQAPAWLQVATRRAA